MNPLHSLSKHQVKRHALIWIILIAYLNFDAPVPGTWAAKIAGGAVESVNYILVFYALSLVVLPVSLVRRRIFRMVAGLLLCYSSYAAVTFLNYFRLIPFLGGYSFHGDEPLSYLLLDDVFYFFIIALAATASFYYRYSIGRIRQQSEKEKALLAKELNFLKNQFNAHITFNFLNYCYSKIHNTLPDTAESIGFFSDNLRYAIGARPDEKVPLAAEIIYIDNFIHLQDLLGTVTNASLEQGVGTDGIFIYPHILDSLLAEAFEQAAGTPVTVRLKTTGTNLEFVVGYTPDSSMQNTAPRINPDHVIQTLDLYYPGNFELKRENRDGSLTLTLTVELSDGHTMPAGAAGTTGRKFISRETVRRAEGEPKPLMRLNNVQVCIHLLCWTLLIVYDSIVSNYDGAFPAQLLSNTLIYFICMGVFYATGLYIFPAWWESRKIALVLAMVLLLLVYWVCVYFIFREIMPALGIFVGIEKYSIALFLKERFYYFALFGTAGAASFFSRFGLFKLRQQEQQEKLLLGRELHYLKNQFNSPLTFRFLDFCSGSIEEHSPETARSIRIFSDMLHYTLETLPEEKVTLSREIAYIENFISIQKLLSEKVYARFSYEGVAGDKRILSRIIVTFVENAFKHGLCNDPRFPLQISLTMEGGRLVFTIRNKINPNKPVDTTKKGIANVTHILDLYYGGRYELTRKVTAREYALTLALVPDD